MRITERMVFRQATIDVTSLRSRLFELQRQGTTGKKFHSLQEEPTSAERIRILRSAREATLHYEKNITRSRTQLDTADASLEEATNIIIRAKEIALSMGTNTVSGDERNIVAEEARSLFESMLSVANTQAAGEFVFGGFQTDQRPFQSDGSYIGDNGVKEVDVGPNAKLAVNVSGETAFTIAGGTDILGELDALRQALATNDVLGIQGAIDTMDQALDQITIARTGAGLKLNQLDVAQGVRNRLEDSLRSEESQLIDIDPVEVFLDLNATMRALEDAISVSQKVTNTSVLGV